MRGFSRRKFCSLILASVGAAAVAGRLEKPSKHREAPVALGYQIKATPRKE